MRGLFVSATALRAGVDVVFRHTFDFVLRPQEHGNTLMQFVRLHAHDALVAIRSEEHTSELQSLMRISYAVFCLKKKTKHTKLPVNTYIHTKAQKILITHIYNN